MSFACVNAAAAERLLVLFRDSVRSIMSGSVGGDSGRVGGGPLMFELDEYNGNRLVRLMSSSGGS